MILKIGNAVIVVESVVGWYRTTEPGGGDRLTVQCGPQEWWFDGEEAAAVELVLERELGPQEPALLPAPDAEPCVGCGGPGWFTLDHARVECPNCNTPAPDGTE